MQVILKLTTTQIYRNCRTRVQKKGNFMKYSVTGKNKTLKYVTQSNVCMGCGIAMHSNVSPSPLCLGKASNMLY